MSTYIITRVTNRDGTPCTQSPQVKQLGRRCAFIRPPASGKSLLGDYTDGGGLLRIPHVISVRPLATDGLRVETTDSVYDFRQAAGQVSMLDRLEA